MTPAPGVLEVEFHHGGIYRYYDVPAAEADALVSADSVGRCLNTVIKPRYAVRRVSDRPDRDDE